MLVTLFQITAIQQRGGKAKYLRFARYLQWVFLQMCPGKFKSCKV